MELLLNIFWLALMLPAVWLWRTRRRSVRRDARWQIVLLLACILVLLFPVVSATDDLHPMRAEMEEANPFKRVAKQGSGNQTSTWLLALGCLFACASARWIAPKREFFSLVWQQTIAVPEHLPVRTGISRAPPSPCLG